MSKLKLRQKIKNELWKPVAGFENYEVSSLGRVWSKRRQGSSGGLLTPTADKAGYLSVKLQGKTVSLHRLVAGAFLPNPLNLPEVNHKDTIKANCVVDNLEWRSQLGNRRHAVKVGAKGDGVTEFSEGVWRARYYPEPGKRKHLGLFKTKAEAIAVRKAALGTMKEII